MAKLNSTAKKKRGRKPLPIAKDRTELYHLYIQQTRNVHKAFRRFAFNNGEEYTYSQLMNELETQGFIRKYNSKYGKKGDVKWKEATAYVLRLVNRAYTWSKHQYEVAIQNVNSYIDKAFTAALNESFDDVTSVVWNIMRQYKGYNDNVKVYYITQNDIDAETPYYLELIQSLKLHGVTKDEIFGSQ